MGMFSVQWKSHEFHPDGRKRSRPPASTVHGWIMKWRGTFSGDEKLRTLGMREMREASAVRKHIHNLTGNKVARSDNPRPSDGKHRPALSRSASTKDSRTTSSRPTPQRSASMRNPEPKRSNSTRPTPKRSESVRSPERSTSLRKQSHQRSMSMQTPAPRKRSESTSRPTPSRRGTTGGTPSNSRPSTSSSRPPVSGSASLSRRNTSRK